MHKDRLDEKDGYYNFSWGDTRGLRNLILSIYTNLDALQTMPLRSYGYPPYEGDPELVEHFRDLTELLTGVRYPYIITTQGCTHAVNAATYALKNEHTLYGVTRDLYFPRYPTMLKSLGLEHRKQKEGGCSTHDVLIVDSPSNPEGKVGTLDEKTDKIIWDGAYQSPTYGMLLGVNTVPNSQVFCGSMSKLTGINGIRIGWTATMSPFLHEKMRMYVESSICGVSYPSQYVALEILKDQKNLEEYFARSAQLINNNKEEVLKLKHIFGSDSIPAHGMFAFFKTDDRMEQVFKNAKVIFTKGSDCGAEFQSVRINLGNPNEMTKEMVQRILKQDRRANK